MKRSAFNAEQFLDAFTRAEAVGCEFHIEVPALGGQKSVALSPQQLVRLIADKQSVYAEVMGLTVPEYNEWRQLQGSVCCSAATAHGRQCRNTIPGASWLEPEAWKAARSAGGYCQVHGGGTRLVGKGAM
ncbi:hypothetical protein ACU4GI_33405 [Cupriavidus basilensis]